MRLKFVRIAPGSHLRTCYRIGGPRALNMDDDDPRLRWHRLRGVSPESKASIDGRLISDHPV